MKQPSIPINDAARVASLVKLDVLDTPPDERFDRITRLAKHLFEVPIVLISLVDKNRQWFKSKQGLDVNETGRDISFCGHAIAKPISSNHADRIMEVPDTHLDWRFADNPLVIDDPKIRSYAGFVLRSHDDYNLGTLCIIDRKPKTLSPKEREMLFDFGMIAQNALQSLRHEDKDIHTQIYNRRGFLTVAEYMLENCHRQKTLATLFYFDILHYDSLIAEYGQLIEKDLLNDFVGLLKNTFRKSDLLARISDRRFVAVTTHSNDSDNPKILLQRLSERTKMLNEVTGQKFQIKYRVGLITSEPEYLKTSGRLLDLVDKRMREQQFSDSHSIVS